VLLEAFERYHVWQMITNPALVTTFTHQAHIVVDICVVAAVLVIVLFLFHSTIATLELVQAMKWHINNGITTKLKFTANEK
jgi:hypothetical protein